MNRKNEAGQSLVETVLLTSILIVTFAFFFKSNFKEQIKCQVEQTGAKEAQSLPFYNVVGTQLKIQSPPKFQRKKCGP